MNSWRDILPDRRERPFRRDQMRHVVHLAVDTERSRVWLGREGRHHAAGMRQIGTRWREARIDGCDLIGMNGNASYEAVTSCDPATFRQSPRILEIRIQRAERLDARRAGGKQTLRPRDLIRERPVPVRLLV